MKPLNSFNSTDHADLFDYSVVDQNQESIGTVQSLWTNHASGQLEFLGVKTGWLFGSSHVVPAGKAQFDEAARTIQVPYALTLVKDAPTIESDAEITDEQEAEIFRYYGGARSTGVTTGATAATAATATRSADVADSTSAAAPDLAATAPAGGATMARAAQGSDDIEVPLSEEKVNVGKRTVDAGQVRLRKVVRTEVVNQPVEVRREDVVVERVPAGQVRTGTGDAKFDEQVIDVPLTREEAVVSKEAHVTGAVRLRKTADTETQNVSETVRKEDVEVLRDGQAEATREQAARR